MAWVVKDCNDHWVSTPLLCAGSPTTRSGCPEPHPAWPWMPPGMGHVPTRHHPLSEKCPPNIQPKPSLSQFKTIPPCIITIHPHKQPFPLLFMCSFQVLEGHNEVPAEPSLLQAKQSQFPQPFIIGEVLQPSDHVSVPPLNTFQELHVFPCAGGPRPGRSTPDESPFHTNNETPFHTTNSTNTSGSSTTAEKSRPNYTLTALWESGLCISLTFH